MFESLTNRLSQAFAKITSRGVLSESDIDNAMREIRVALLEADVSLSLDGMEETFDEISGTLLSSLESNRFKGFEIVKF